VRSFAFVLLIIMTFFLAGGSRLRAGAESTADQEGHDSKWIIHTLVTDGGINAAKTIAGQRMVVRYWYHSVSCDHGMLNYTREVMFDAKPEREANDGIHISIPLAKLNAEVPISFAGDELYTLGGHVEVWEVHLTTKSRAKAISRNHFKARISGDDPSLKDFHTSAGEKTMESEVLLLFESRAVANEMSNALSRMIIAAGPAFDPEHKPRGEGSP
jgi:hypothetical protein